MYLLQTNTGKSTFGVPYNSTQGMGSGAKLFIVIAFLIIGIYIGIKVWLSLKKTKNK